MIIAQCRNERRADPTESHSVDLFFGLPQNETLTDASGDCQSIPAPDAFSSSPEQLFEDSETQNLRHSSLYYFPVENLVREREQRAASPSILPAGDVRPRQLSCVCPADGREK